MNRQQIEQEILKVLDEEQTAVGISDKLFTPDGLFSLLATSEEERRTLVQSELFKKSQKRFRELQFKEAEQFQQATSNLQGTSLGNNYAVKIERAKSV
jgi:hypothetical protein